MPPKPDAHEQIEPPAGSREHDPSFSQGLGLHASAGTNVEWSKGQGGVGDVRIHTIRIVAYRGDVSGATYKTKCCVMGEGGVPVCHAGQKKSK